MKKTSTIIIVLLFFILAGAAYLVYQSQYFVKVGIIESKKQQQLGEEEKAQMFSAAREYIKGYSVKGLQVDLTIVKVLNDRWALLHGEPVNVETDSIGVVMEKVNGKWETKTFGTLLLEWKKKVPELFK